MALPGLGAATGRVPPRRCARLMWAGYQLCRDAEFPDFGSMRAALLDRLCGPASLPPGADQDDSSFRAPSPEPLRADTFLVREP
ncbi:MAG TPA: hypothetical protein VFT91_02800, partial [Dehalococcoidia bacterium]|nr:hypothetical protein [Dehalococcoidia bacterium]